jgi:GNAT superfamily N-acetyltransferase
MFIQVRKAEVEDYEDVYALIQKFALLLGRAEELKTNVRQMTKDQSAFNAVIAEDGSKIIGFATWFVAYYSFKGLAVYLDDLFVEREYRGRGVGKLLMHKVIEIAHTKGCTMVRWQVSASNKTAINFYQKMGAHTEAGELNCTLII